MLFTTIKNPNINDYASPSTPNVASISNYIVIISENDKEIQINCQKYITTPNHLTQFFNMANGIDGSIDINYAVHGAVHGTVHGDSTHIKFNMKNKILTITQVGGAEIKSHYNDAKPLLHYLMGFGHLDVNY